MPPAPAPPGGSARPDPVRATAGHLAAFAAELERLERAGLRRRVRHLDSGPGPEVELEGRRVVLFASNDYLGLARHPEVTAAACDAAARFGAGAGSARLVVGGLPLHDRLEEALAGWKGTDDAVLFSSGYLTNVGTVGALVGRGDAVFCDVADHASLVDGARLSGAEVHFYRHGDPAHLATLLERFRRGGQRGSVAAGRALVVTDSVFSMDGDLAPLPELVESCTRHGALLMVDEAHATGVVGPGGRGAVGHFGLEGRVDVVMGTLSKALGAAGGFVAGPSALCDLLRNRARTFIYDTALPPPTVAAAAAALGVLAREPERPERVRGLARSLARGLAEAGWAVPDPAAAIVPVLVGEAEAASALAERLLEQGILVPAIRPPTVPRGTARLRLAVMATHADDHIELVRAAFASLRAGRDAGPRSRP